MIDEGTILQKRYRIGKRIGEGGMGAVYLATDERFGSQVAIKETLFTDDHYKKAFKREARLLNSLKHPALPKVSDHFIENNGQYIVMEYIAGDDLFETLEATSKPFPIADVLTWSEQLLDALEYLHGQENPVIHRDIKPQNLKMTPDGQIILLDFGLAKGNPTDANHQTAAQSIFGYSRNYASLEQIQGTGTDPRSDIYSLAATLYHLVTGKAPADALTRVMNVLNEEPDPLIPAVQQHEQVTENLSNVLQQSMSLNANLRPQSTTEMRGMLSGKITVESFKQKETVSNKAANTGLLAQETQILSNKTDVPGMPSEIKTEILPQGATGQDSVQTKMASPRTAVSIKENTGEDKAIAFGATWNPRYAGATVLAAFLLVGSVVGGAYWLGSDMFGGEASVDSANAPGNSNSATTSENPTAEIVNSNVGETDNEIEMTDTETPEPAPVETPVERMGKEVEKPKLSAKKIEKAPARGTYKQEDVPKNLESTAGDILLDDGKIVTKEAKITNGKVETPDVLVDGNRVILKRSGNQPRVVVPRTKAEFDRLTPAQKRRLLRERKKAIDRRKAEERRKASEREKRRLLERLKRRRPPPPPPRDP
ncbi:MAG: serine/threonine protein kinase [Pyrinomonadaceae bacterium]|nr:serine/threonine protein kinase [Pyrinomonadaceae bacterium]